MNDFENEMIPEEQAPQPAEQIDEPVKPEETGNYTGQRVYQPEANRVPWSNPYVPHQNPVYPPYRPVTPPPVPTPMATPSTAPATKKSGAGKVLKGVFTGILITALVITNMIFGANIIRLRNEIKLIRQNNEENIAVLRDELAASKPGSDGNSVSGTPNTSVQGLTPAQVFARNVSSVVAINCKVSAGLGQAVSSGSGFVWTNDGYIVTNYHVVQNSKGITVVTSDGQEHEATYIGGDSSNDIAVLKIEAEGLTAVTIGSSSDLIVGDQVVAIGNALGELASTLTVGYVSAIDRVVATDGTQMNMLQTDAAINSGNSGGPLFNLKGEVVGITTAKYSGSSLTGASIEGIGFAIPMDDVIGLLEDLKEYGYITGGYLGVTVSDMSKTDADRYGLPMGVLVHEVVAGSCADKGGVKAQDILLELGGHTIGNMNDLTRALREFDAGDTVTAVVHRVSQGGEVILTLTLDAKPTTAAPSSVPDNGSAQNWFDFFFGN